MDLGDPLSPAVLGPGLDVDLQRGARAHHRGRVLGIARRAEVGGHGGVAVTRMDPHRAAHRIDARGNAGRARRRSGQAAAPRNRPRSASTAAQMSGAGRVESSSCPPGSMVSRLWCGSATPSRARCSRCHETTDEGCARDRRRGARVRARRCPACSASGLLDDQVLTRAIRGHRGHQDRLRHWTPMAGPSRSGPAPIRGPRVGAGPAARGGAVLVTTL